MATIGKGLFPGWKDNFPDKSYLFKMNMLSIASSLQPPPQPPFRLSGDTTPVFENHSEVHLAKLWLIKNADITAFYEYNPKKHEYEEEATTLKLDYHQALFAVICLRAEPAGLNHMQLLLLEPPP